MKKELNFILNGKEYSLMIDPWLTLQDVIRDVLKLKGTKKGCESGKCGSCTVIMNGKAIRSCLMLAMHAKGASILTIEGLSKDGELHPLQRSFIEHGAVQCGFCTPGMILTAKAFLDENPKPTEDEVREAIKGNICRCTGYVKIVEAILAVSRKEE